VRTILNQTSQAVGITSNASITKPPRTYRGCPPTYTQTSPPRNKRSGQTSPTPTTNTTTPTRKQPSARSSKRSPTQSTRTGGPQPTNASTAPTTRPHPSSERHENASDTRAVTLNLSYPGSQACPRPPSTPKPAHPSP